MKLQDGCEKQKSEYEFTRGKEERGINEDVTISSLGIPTFSSCV